MSILSALFGGSTPEKILQTAEECFIASDWGNARIYFQKALAKGKQLTEASKTEIKQKLVRCLEQLAEAQLREAERLIEQGDYKEAFEHVDNACEIHETPEIVRRAHDLERRLNAALYPDDFAEDSSAEASSEDLLAVIAGTWSDPQASEFAGLPDAFRSAVLAAYHGEFETALRHFEATEKTAADEVGYYWFEKAKTLTALERDTEAVETLDRFLTWSEGRDESTPVRLEALYARAQILTHAENFEAAENALKAIIRLAPNNHRGFLNYGIFLREQGMHDRALEFLDKARALMSEMNPDFRVIREMGFCQLKTGKLQDAKECFRAVIAHQASKGEHEQYDPGTTVALASLHEQDSEFEDAADLYRHLADGTDITNHFVYNLEAARLLKAAGKKASLVEHYLERAEKLATENEQQEAVTTLRNQP